MELLERKNTYDSEIDEFISLAEGETSTVELATKATTQIRAGAKWGFVDKMCGNNNYKERCVCGGCHGGYKCSSAGNGKMCVKHDRTLGPNSLCGNDA